MLVSRLWRRYLDEELGTSWRDGFQALGLVGRFAWWRPKLSGVSADGRLRLVIRPGLEHMEVAFRYRSARGEPVRGVLPLAQLVGRWERWFEALERPAEPSAPASAAQLSSD